MKEPDDEGLASHNVSESCAAPQGRRRSVDRGRVGRVLSRENLDIQGADAVEKSGRRHRPRRYREMVAKPARSETPSTRGRISSGTREIPWLPWRHQGRIGSRRTHVDDGRPWEVGPLRSTGEAAKQGPGTGRGGREGRGRTKGNTPERNRTGRRAGPARPARSSGTAGARRDRKQRFTALLHHVYDVDRLRAAYSR